MSILGFLFGKKPKIRFTSDGRAKHDHESKKWDDWKARFEKNSQYNWKEHSGTLAGDKTLQPGDKPTTKK